MVASLVTEADKPNQTKPNERSSSFLWVASFKRLLRLSRVAASKIKVFLVERHSLNLRNHISGLPFKPGYLVMGEARLYVIDGVYLLKFVR